jgi:hypothetical protein
MVPLVPPGVPIVAASVVCLAGLRTPRDPGALRSPQGPEACA